MLIQVEAARSAEEDELWRDQQADPGLQGKEPFAPECRQMLD